MNNVNDLRNNDFLTDFIIINKGREFKVINYNLYIYLKLRYINI